MTDIRCIVAWGPGVKLTKDWFSNTIYFSVDITSVDYADIANAVRDAYQAADFTIGTKIEVRAYNMDDPEPRPERAYATATKVGAQPEGPHQVALCLNFFSERNLPRQRGRIYLGPYNQPLTNPRTAEVTGAINLGKALANVGGVNCDWSVYSPTTAAAGGDPTRSISTIWVDNSWDIIRSRKLAGTVRTTFDVNE